MKLRILSICLLVTIIIVGCYPVESNLSVPVNNQSNVNLSSNMETNTSVVQQDENTDQPSIISEISPNNQSESGSSQIGDNGNIQSTDQYSNITNYNGKWVSTNYQIVQMDGYAASFGSELYLKYKNDGIIEMNIYDISPPPANRIASIEIEVKISPEGIGTFTFDDDGWGSHGSGTIELKEDQVIINIDSQIEEGNNPDWRMYGGQRIFVRENMQKDGA